ncbi:TPA: hypothetical protein JZY45_002452, partial [Enterococcus faecium]|nr:hypothetical protein [Enterococcus faecium]
MQLLLYRIGDSTKIRFLINVRFRVIYSTVLPKGIPQRQKWMIHMEEIMQMILGNAKFQLGQVVSTPAVLETFNPLQTANGIPEALSNLWFRQEISIAEIEDAVLDAKNGKELANSLNRIKLFRKFTLDRELDGMVRLKGTDVWKNISYLKVYTATPPKK